MFMELTADSLQLTGSRISAREKIEHDLEL